jgi:hypothetical protein
MSEVIAEQISIGLQKLYAVVELLSYQGLEDLRKEIGFLELMIMQRQQKLRDNALKSKGGK